MTVFPHKVETPWERLRFLIFLKKSCYKTSIQQYYTKKSEGLTSLDTFLH